MALSMSSWDEFWEWFSGIDEDARKTEMMIELNKDDWIKRLSPDVQYKVFRNAPMDIKKSMKKFPNIFHSETLVLLQMESDRRYKKMKKYM